jgi:hypothetical protein
VPTTRNLSIALASCLGLALTAAPIWAADAPAPAKKADAAAAKPAADPNAPKAPESLSDSPYSNGPPAVTGGYTDTTQGGKKGSGDPNAIPPPAGAAAPK